MCPIPGDNGNPQQEKEKQNERIKEYGMTSSNIKPPLKINTPEKTVWPKIK